MVVSETWCGFILLSMDFRTDGAAPRGHLCCVPCIMLQHIYHLKITKTSILKRRLLIFSQGGWVIPSFLWHLPITKRVTLGGWFARKKVRRKSSSSSSKVISIKSEYLSEVRTNRSQECSFPLICWHSMFAKVTSIEKRMNRTTVMIKVLKFEIRFLLKGLCVKKIAVQ